MFIPDGALVFLNLGRQQADRLRALSKREDTETIAHYPSSGESTRSERYVGDAICLVEKGKAVFTPHDSTCRVLLSPSNEAYFSAVVIPSMFGHEFEALEYGTEIIGVVGDDFVRAVLAPEEQVHK